MITCVQIAVIGRETSVELGRSLVASARDVPLMTSVDGTLMTRQVGSKITADLRITRVRRTAPHRSTRGLILGSLCAGGGCWLLTAV